jgi:hypothetical protein
MNVMVSERDRRPYFGLIVKGMAPNGPTPPRSAQRIHQLL